MKDLFSKIKTFVDVYKVYLFLVAIFVSGGAYYATDELEVEDVKSDIPAIQPPVGKQIIIKSIPCNNEAHILELH